MIRGAIFHAMAHGYRLFNHVRQTYAGSDPLAQSKLAAVYVHFDREGVIHDYVLHQLRELVSTGFRITFVTNSPKWPAQSVEAIAPLCRNIIWRRNIGYDFGAYKDGITSLMDELGQMQGLLLMNDSVYGPFTGLKDCLSTIDRSTTDVWGITDTWERQFHIQSYFMLFFPNALKSPAFAKFWRRLPYFNSKKRAINNGEVRLTQSLTEQKLRAQVMIPFWTVGHAIRDRLMDMNLAELPEHQRNYAITILRLLIDGRPLNPTHHFWDVLIEEYKCPFIKRELIKINPANIPFVSRWPEVVARAGPYDVSMIWRHLQT